MIKIRQDGVDWPLETFIDAYRFIRIGEHWDGIGGGTYLQAITREGEMVANYASHLNFHDLIAVKADGVAVCEACDTIKSGVFDWGWCRECDAKDTWSCS